VPQGFSPEKFVLDVVVGSSPFDLVFVPGCGF
jgi:hypothetical protein